MCSEICFNNRAGRLVYRYDSPLAFVLVFNLYIQHMGAVPGSTPGSSTFLIVFFCKLRVSGKGNMCGAQIGCGAAEKSGVGWLFVEKRHSVLGGKQEGASLSKVIWIQDSIL